MDTLRAIHARASVRAFAPDIVSSETINGLLRAAVRAPTAMHGEPWMFAVVQDTALLAMVDDACRQGLLAKAIAAHVLEPSFAACHGANTLIAICAKAHGPLVDADCWLAAENLMLAATDAGLGSCCVGSTIAALNSPDIKAAIGIPHDVRIIVSIVIGVPAVETSPSARREPLIISWR